MIAALPPPQLLAEAVREGGYVVVVPLPPQIGDALVITPSATPNKFSICMPTCATENLTPLSAPITVTVQEFGAPMFTHVPHDPNLLNGCNEWDSDLWIPGDPTHPRPEFQNDGVTPCPQVVLP